jgi:hypothetical protein
MPDPKIDVSELRGLLEKAPATLKLWVQEGGERSLLGGQLAAYVPGDGIRCCELSESGAALIVAALKGLPSLLDQLEQARREVERLSHPAQEKRAPVQGWPDGIPWSMHLRAYEGYCKKWSPQPALIDLDGRNCRGGFVVGELDDFIPGWRDELSEITALQSRVAELTAAVERAHEALGLIAEGWDVIESDGQIITIAAPDHWEWFEGTDKPLEMIIDTGPHAARQALQGE